MPVSLKGVFQSQIEHCPANPREEHRCVGRFVIYSYLAASGEFDWPAPSGPPSRFRVAGKILPQKITIPFKCDFSDTIGSDDEVEPCMSPVGEQGAGDQYEEMGVINASVVTHVKIERVGVPQGTSKQTGNCVDGKVTFQWVSGVINTQIALNAAGNLGIPLIGGSFGLGANAAIGFGGFSIAPVEVAYEICYVDGCQKSTIPNDTALDAVAIFSAPQKLTLTKI